MNSSLQYSKKASKTVRYEEILPQIKSLVESETDMIANMANICAVLKEVFDFFWVGFYLVKDNELVLGPFQGSLACTRISKGKGVCGTAWEQAHTLIVPDVDQFEGHIACSSLSRSELVLPLFYKNEIIAVLDIDSQHLDHFDDTDAFYLEQMLSYLSK
ncbi:MAG: GAF domain-containing protein [Bacteroidales bacterium]|jgi:GAF domain-containing protein|nr:GAF domain-containing protein [Bacteroidales bacterium]MDD2687620.1 GAF domain-containing protein [Bacteroidales bacterium]MDD3331228.1 GAF domain-containing protein [Bacteroidales bacterium]MDD3692053.1 GAF domain-containing protein [Bacteroidales bacterium]MDD4045154.1 GAF domain-containing protein [Bacteroidales bacterium]